MKFWFPVFIAALFVAAPAQAIRCSDWTRLGPEQRTATLHQSYDDLSNESRLQKYQVNWGRIRACLVRSTPAVEIDFDDACARGKSASMDVLDEILRSYLRSCVGN